MDPFEAHRSRLLSLAYRVLGSLAEAEDVLQEAHLRWLRRDSTPLDSDKAWLERVVMNLCLDQLKSARARRESYVGTFPLLIHVVSAIARMWSRRGAPRAALSWRLRLHRYSAYFLLLVFAGHILVTRGASVLFDTFPGFEGVAFTFRWVPAYFWPYYLLLSLAGWYHAVHGLSVAAAAARGARAAGAQPSGRL